MITLVLMAAGFGRRFPGDKLNSLYRGKPLYRHTLDRLIECARQRKEETEILVISREGILSDCPLPIRINRQAEEGMSASIRCALSHRDPKSRAIAFFVADQPELSLETILSLLDEFDKAEKPMACVSYEGRLGNPAVFDRSCFAKLAALRGEQGGKVLLQARPDQVASVPAAKTEGKDRDS